MLYISSISKVSSFKEVFLRRNRYSCRIRHFGNTACTNDIINNDIDLNVNDILNGISDNPLPVNIYVDSDILRHLKMKNHERKARVMLPKDRSKYMSDISIDFIRNLVEEKMLSLKNQPYVLRYTLPGYQSSARQFINNEEVIKTFHLIHDTTNNINIPSINLHIDTFPGKFPPPTEEYLKGMCDPSESQSYTILSFYHFGNIDRPQSFAETLRELWKPFRAHGRVYVAKEGVNAQCAVPSNVVDNFDKATHSLSFFNGMYLNIDHKMSREEYENEKPFKAMHIRVRSQIVADGLEQPLDWANGGNEMDPLTWHDAIDDKHAVILDCRNSYESDVGTFENAIPLNTTFFRESWDAIDNILKDKPKDTPILTFCTGGIRCIKTNAYITQKLGFENVNRLQGGIISYARELEASSSIDTLTTDSSSSSSSSSDDASPHLTRDLSSFESKFKGVNYVFDERMQTRITSDVLASCETCGSPCDSFTNCADFKCHIRFIQCDKCSGRYNGCCSVVCQKRYHSVVAELMSSASTKNSFNSDQAVTISSGNNKGLLSRNHKNKTQMKNSDSFVIDANTFTHEEEEVISKSIETEENKSEIRDHASALDAQLAALSIYCERYSANEPELLQELREETKVAFPRAARMLSGHLQGRILAMLPALCRAERVIELGSFTGYSTLCLAEGLATVSTLSNNNKDTSSSSSSSSQPLVISCEPDSQAASVAMKYFQRSAYKDMIELRQEKALEVIKELRQCMIDNNNDEGKFQIAFVDADKKSYSTYIHALIGNEEEPCLLEDGAIIVVDNTLWKGLVMKSDADLEQHAPAAELYGNADRMDKLASVMHEFNVEMKTNSNLDKSNSDSNSNKKKFRLHPVILPLRDGLSLIRFSLL